jgi:hypothetical protein
MTGQVKNESAWIFCSFRSLAKRALVSYVQESFPHLIEALPDGKS